MFFKRSLSALKTLESKVLSECSLVCSFECSLEFSLQSSLGYSLACFLEKSVEWYL